MSGSGVLSLMEQEAISQSIAKASAAPSDPACMSAAEREALTQSTAGRGCQAPASDATGKLGVEATALEESFGGLGSSRGSDRPTPPARAPESNMAPDRPAGERSTVNAAVLAAVELAKGHKATAAFVLQTRASGDPELRQALLAGHSGASANNLSQAAAAEIAAFLDAGSSGG